jgi:hypothetical protein
MMHKTVLEVESLEVKTLLSGPSTTPAIAGLINPDVSPTQFPGVRTSTLGISYSMTTDRSIYQADQPVHMTFTETNVTGQAIRINAGPSNTGFIVTQNGRMVWQSNAGPLPLYLTVITLQPGQSLTYSATWNGVPNGGSTIATGMFTVTNQQAPLGPAATFQIADSPNPPSNPGVPIPGPAPPVSVSPPSPISVALTTDHAVYRRRHPVHVTMTFTNVGSTAVTLTSDPNGMGFVVMDGSTVVWRSNQSLPALGAQTLQPGQSIMLSGIWRGRPNQPGFKTLRPGRYTVQANDAGYQGTAVISIQGRGRRFSQGS